MQEFVVKVEEFYNPEDRAYYEVEFVKAESASALKEWCDKLEKDYEDGHDTDVFGNGHQKCGEENRLSLGFAPLSYFYDDWISHHVLKNGEMVCEKYDVDKFDSKFLNKSSYLFFHVYKLVESKNPHVVGSLYVHEIIPQEVDGEPVVHMIPIDLTVDRLVRKYALDIEQRYADKFESNGDVFERVNAFGLTQHSSEEK